MPKKSNKPRAAIASASEHGGARKEYFGKQLRTPKKLGDVILGGTISQLNKMRRKAI